MAVYSAQLFAGTPPSGPHALYTVPAAIVAVIRDIEVYNASGGTTSFAFTHWVAGVRTSYIWASSSLANGTWQQWEGRAVLNAGESLLSEFGAGFVYAIVSGYQLTAP